MLGTVLAVCTSQGAGIPKHSQRVATLGAWGLEGDYHNRPERMSYRRKIMVPNVDRHLLLVGQEAKAAVVRSTGEILGSKDAFLKHGSLSENILVNGLGDLSLLAGQRLLIRNGDIVLRVVEPADPCKHVRAAYGVETYINLKHQRGMYCAIESGIGKHIWPNDQIETE